jgi:hypothetical protein
VNERYAVDPDAPCDWRELKLLLDQVGLQTGRFLAHYPSDWEFFVRQHFASASDMDRKRIMELLARRNKVALACNEPFRRHLDWPENAQKAKASSPAAFEDVVSLAGNAVGLKTLQDVLYEAGKDWPSGVGAHVPMQAAAYARSAAPLFELSAEVIMVDRFFRLRTDSGQWDQRRRRVLEAFLQLAAKNTNFQCLRLVMERPSTGNASNIERSLTNDREVLLSGVRANHVDLEFELRDSVGHGRYLFSIHGGLQFDHGFDEDTRKTNHIHWLALPELEPLLKLYGR